jgi:hypothetical protein
MTRVVVHAKRYAMDQGPILFYPCNFQDFSRELSRNPENDPFGVDIIFSITSLIVSLFIYTTTLSASNIKSVLEWTEGL